MNIVMSELLKYTVEASDSDVGGIKDVLFDDDKWTIRYLHVDTQRWVPLSKKVLVTPVAVNNINKDSRSVRVSHSRQTVLDSPTIDQHQPVSRQYEQIFFDYFGYGYYWHGLDLWGNFQAPGTLAEPQRLAKEQVDAQHHSEQSQDNHLRSISEIKHYNVAESDGMKGYVHDCVFDATSWKILYLVIDDRNWLPGGRKVLIAPDTIESVSWKDQAVFCELTIEQINQLPDYNKSLLNDRAYLQRVNDGLSQSA